MTPVGRPRQRGRFVVLFVLALALHVILPLLRSLELLDSTSGAALLAVIGYAGWLTIERRHLRLLYLALLALSLVSTVSLFLGGSAPRVAWLAYHALLLSLTTASVVAWVARRERITVDTIFAALSGFYLMAFAWGLIFSLVDLLSPGSFSVDLHAQLQDAFYFSFVTITTLGYGDIVPVGRLARALVTTEALLGQIYLVVLVARLVSLQLAHAQAKD